MFKILAPGSRKRRVWSPTTIALSVAFHGLFFYGVARASMGDAPAARPVEPPIWIPVEPAPPPPPAPVVRQPETPRPPTDAPHPVVGRTVVPVPPAVVPPTLPPPTAEPVTNPEHYTGQGKPGDVFGTPDAGDTRAPTGNPGGAPGSGDGDVLSPEAVTDLPEVQNRREMVRLLERTYPGALRDAGMAGQVVVQFVVGTDGRVDAQSIRIVSSTHSAFEEPSRRAAERMRFRPARVNGQPVRVMISLPIDWKVPE